MEIKKTCRGFEYGKFYDFYGNQCSIQKSSLADTDAIWLGIDEANPKIMASTVMEGGTGWIRYPLPEGVSLTTRMHLDQQQAKDLIKVLQVFVKTGEIS